MAGPANIGNYTGKMVQGQQDARNHQNKVADEGLKTKVDNTINKAMMTAAQNCDGYV